MCRAADTVVWAAGCIPRSTIRCFGDRGAVRVVRGLGLVHRRRLVRDGILLGRGLAGHDSPAVSLTTMDLDPGGFSREVILSVVAVEVSSKLLRMSIVEPASSIRSDSSRNDHMREDLRDYLLA